MDIRCTKCGEMWDVDTLHDEVSERFPIAVIRAADETSADYERSYARMFEEVRADFGRRGCAAITGARCNVDVDRGAAMLSSALFDLMGDDVDGIASELEDAGY